MNEATSQKVTIGVAAFFLGMAFYWAFLANGTPSELPPADEEESVSETMEGQAPGGQETPSPSPTLPPESDEEIKPSADTAVAKADYSVSIKNQTPGNRVTIESLTLPATTWVGIHDNQNGKPGVVLGARRFRAGSYTNEFVQLFIAPMNAGETYYAVFLKDDGDDTFDYTKDTPLHDETGNLIMTMFKADGSN